MKGMKLSSSYGMNIVLAKDYKTATKKEGKYNHATVCSKESLNPGQPFQFEIGYGGDYDGCVQFGLTSVPPDRATRYEYASQHLQGQSFIMSTDFADTTWLFVGGKKGLRVPLADLQDLSSASVMYTQAGSIHITLNHSGVLTPLLIKLPSSLCPLPPLYGVIDLYGKCNQATLVEKVMKENQLPNIFEVLEEDVHHVSEELRRKEIKIHPEEYSQKLHSDPVSDVSSAQNSFQQILPSGNGIGSESLPSTQTSQLIDHHTLSEEASQRIPSVSTRVCAPKPPCSSGYLELCRRFLKQTETAQLKDCYFDQHFDKCYCDNCSSVRGDATISGRGSARYAIPKGWAMFGLILNNRARIIDDKDLFVKGLKAYHGTQVCNLKSIIEDSGGLLIPGTLVSDVQKVEQPRGHFNESWRPAHHDPHQIFLSPSIEYASHREVYAKSTEYRDEVTGVCYRGKVCLKVLVEPGAHKVSTQTTTNTGQQIDALFSNSELEWCVKAHTQVHLYGLLVKLVKS